LCDAFLITKSMIAASVDEIKQNAKHAFEHTIKEEGLELRRERGELYMGNLHGLGLAGLLERMPILEEQQKEKLLKRPKSPPWKQR